eukprot:8685715-Pyramimonas_sp.AAC.1
MLGLLSLEGCLVLLDVRPAVLLAGALDAFLGARGVDPAVVDVRLLHAQQLEPELGGVDDDRARAGPVLGEGHGAPDEEAEVLGAAPRHQFREPRGSSSNN